MPFQIGDVVQVVGLPNSQWQDSSGIVVAITKYDDNGKSFLEYLVNLWNGPARWFLERHLGRHPPNKIAPFVQAEAITYWEQLDATDITHLTGERDQLPAFLTSHYGWSNRRAAEAVSTFFVVFAERLARAVTSGKDLGRPTAGSSLLKTSLRRHMISSVACWRCKCGASVKAVTEIDKTRIKDNVRLEVACPKCGDKQLVYAHRIIEVTAETPDAA
jgi:hypothetical protein